MALEPRERQPRSVLVVDDDQDVAETLVMLLEAEGFLASFALSGTVALALVATDAPDAVLLDYMLPDMSGGEVGHALRARLAANVRIVMYTSAPEEVVRPTFDGYDAYLNKPVLHDRIVRTLDRVLGTPLARP